MPAIALATRGMICPPHGTVINQIYCPIPADQAQNLLVKALQLPLPASMTEAKGIHQSDVIIRTAMVMAIADLRANPWLLDHVFASLIEDTATAQDYGEKERSKAKDWFLKTDIPVGMDYRLDDVDPVAVSISLVESTEAENTLGDVHYQPTESVEAAWPPLVAAFTPEAYSAATGILKLPASTGDALVVTTGMVVVDKVGRAHAITDVLDRYSIVLTPGTIADFSNAVIKGEKPRMVREIESLAFKETYRIGCHTHGDPTILTWLHSIVVFCLLRYKQALLEARGFERSIISSAPFASNPAFGKENVWTRSISITGYIRNYWPKATQDRILSSTIDPLKYSAVGNPGDQFSAEGDDPLWMSQDGLGLPKK